MQRVPVLNVKPLSSVTPAMREVQEEIERMYRGLLEAEAASEADADEVVRRIRHLEQQLIDMRIAQGGYCLQM